MPISQNNFLTGGEECQRAAKILSTFLDGNKAGPSGAIPQQLLSLAYGVSVFNGREGVSIAKLTKGGWSAPCAVVLEPDSESSVNPGQYTVALIMSESALFDLVLDRKLELGGKHSFEAGPLENSPSAIKPSGDLNIWVRYKNSFISSELIGSHMSGWCIVEDSTRQQRWHKRQVSWVEVLTNKISVDRSSVGNALYVVINIAAPASLGNARGLNLHKLDQKIQERNTLPTQGRVDPSPGAEPPAVVSAQPSSWSYPRSGSIVSHSPDSPLNIPEYPPMYNQSPQGYYSPTAQPNHAANQNYQYQQYQQVLQPGIPNYVYPTIPPHQLAVRTDTQPHFAHPSLTAISYAPQQIQAPPSSTGHSYVNVQKVSQTLYTSGNGVQYLSESHHIVSSQNLPGYG